jgi:hypothetical protein
MTYQVDSVSPYSKKKKTHNFLTQETDTLFGKKRKTDIRNAEMILHFKIDTRFINRGNSSRNSETHFDSRAGRLFIVMFWYGSLL